jgi:hypothetical protein
MPTTYKVQRGDTLGKIALRFYRSASKYPLIVAANRIGNPDLLRVGQLLVIPEAGSTSNGASLPTPTQRLSEQRLALLHPVVADRGRELLREAAQVGLAVMVTQGLRSWKEQDALYARGRTTPPIGKSHIVTNARGGYSWHNFGLAFDVLLLDAMGKAKWDTRHPGWKTLGVLGKARGLDWGGDWVRLKDLAHFQYTCGLSLQLCRTLGVGGLERVWARIH